MNRDARTIVRHRIRTHEAALRLAEHLGYPDRLAPSVIETQARLAEARTILAAIGSDHG